MDGQVVRCASCGKQNRVPRLEEGKRAICGHCKTALPDQRGPVTLTDATFAAAVSSGSWVIDFWAAWCGPCRAIAPILEELAATRSDVTIAKLNVDENPRTAAQFRAQSIPLLVYVRDGAEMGRTVGAVPRARIEAAIAQYLS